MGPITDSLPLYIYPHAPSRNRGAARQRVHQEIHHREELRILVCRPLKLDEEARSQVIEAVESYGRLDTFA